MTKIKLTYRSMLLGSALLLFSQCQSGGCALVRFLPGVPNGWFETPATRKTDTALLDALREESGRPTGTISEPDARPEGIIPPQGTEYQVGGYRSLVPRELSPGVTYYQYERHPVSPRHTIRVLRVLPQAFSRLQVLFSDQWDHPLYTAKVLARPEVSGLMSWCFFGRIPAGDMIGQRCKNQGAQCQPGIYHNAEKRTGKDINRRYTLGIAHNNRPSVFRGGLGPQSGRWYRLAMGGGILLLDQEQYPWMYQQVGTSRYEGAYKKVNPQDFVSSGQAGYPKRATPRSAVGILPDRSLLFVNVGEGKYRFEGGATPAQMALILKKLGAVKGVMYDGGGAPQMVFNSPSGRRMVQTYPEVTRSSNYLYNYAFLVLTH